MSHLNKDLQLATETEDEEEGGFFLVVVRDCMIVLELLASEDETLLLA